MLYQIGPLTHDDGFDLQSVDEKVEADFAEHALIGTRQDLEFAGPGKDPIELRGHLVPFHFGGLSEYELARTLCTSGQPQFVMRGDGTVRGWHVLREVTGKHTNLSSVGVGFEIETGIKLDRCRDPGGDVAGDLIGTLISLFE